ncbi:MAG: transcription elongation factor GreB [Rhodospirillales bacterium]|nr:transcription elongation factor GreB [Rhodospirillales bacterium]
MSDKKKHYVTPSGFSALEDELNHLWKVERPEMVKVVSWAAGNGDRSENGDYIYGKKRLREIDRRVRYLRRQLENAIVVNPEEQQGHGQVRFGAKVTYVNLNDKEITVQIVGMDEADVAQGKISYISPIAKALMRLKVGDSKEIMLPGGMDELEVLSLEYPL